MGYNLRPMYDYFKQPRPIWSLDEMRFVAALCDLTGELKYMIFYELMVLSNQTEKKRAGYYQK